MTSRLGEFPGMLRCECLLGDGFDVEISETSDAEDFDNIESERSLFRWTFEVAEAALRCWWWCSCWWFGGEEVGR